MPSISLTATVANTNKKVNLRTIQNVSVGEQAHIVARSDESPLASDFLVGQAAEKRPDERISLDDEKVQKASPPIRRATTVIRELFCAFFLLKRPGERSYALSPGLSLSPRFFS